MNYCDLRRFWYYTPIFSHEALLKGDLRDTSVRTIATHIEIRTAESFMDSGQLLSWTVARIFKSRRMW